MSLSQIEFVWVRVREEWECFGVNLREDNKVSESKIGEFKMAAIIKWVRMNEWSFLCKIAESKMLEFKMAAIIKWSQNESVKFFCVNDGEGSVSEVFFVQMVGTNLGKCEFERKY